MLSPTCEGQCSVLSQAEAASDVHRVQQGCTLSGT